jgi:hypothetical protein
MSMLRRTKAAGFKDSRLWVHNALRFFRRLRLGSLTLVARREPCILSGGAAGREGLIGSLRDKCSCALIRGIVGQVRIAICAPAPTSNIFHVNSLKSLNESGAPEERRIAKIRKHFKWLTARAIDLVGRNVGRFVGRV